MDSRQECVLRAIIDEYIRTAEPIGSKHINQTCRLGVSPATIRNDMAVLEKEGYIRSPHTSAGRVPTEKGYEYYLKNFSEVKSEKTDISRLKKVVESSQNDESALKSLAKTLVDLSGETAMIAFSPKWSYYTGVSNLFQKPDFDDLSVVKSLSAVVDRFDEVLSELFDRISENTKVMIGAENPFGEDMSAILVKYRLPSNHIGVIGLIGPLRMDYDKNIGLIEGAKEVLAKKTAK